MSAQLDRLIDLLEGIFELDKADLDFGIYRILRIRKEAVSKFLREELPMRVNETLAPFAADTGEIKEKMRCMETEAAKYGGSAENTADYKQLKEQLVKGVDLSGLEADVYSHLFGFFNRYYEEGDFISKRRYKKDVYAISYEGEEVKLYWANQDQYYIKTSEHFKNYSFKDGGKTVHFRIVDASTEQNNNKETNGNGRCFMLWKSADGESGLPVIETNPEDTEMVIRFVYDISPEKKKQAAYNEDNYKCISETIVSKYKNWASLLQTVSAGDSKKKPKTLLEKHLEAYVAKNTFDYFIYKDLRRFLARELDFYIKNEIIFLDDLDTADERRVETYLAKVKAVKRIAKILIDFLSQIEDFQKKLWLKKKLVISTDWCITLDKIPEAFYEEIRKNKAQTREWVELYAVDESAGGGASSFSVKFTDPPKLEFLKEHQNLVIDTKHFSRDFTERLIAAIDNLDEQTNGVLIYSENFQALNLLRERYKSKVDCIYIDPPYNTSASEILYKNGYKHSSWLSLINDRCILARNILSNDGIFAFAIDDTEEKLAHNVLDIVFDKNELGTVVVRNNPSGRPMKTGFAISHEYILFYSKKPDVVVSKIDRTENLDKRYKEKDNIGPFMWELLRKRGSDSERADSPKAYYPIYYNGKAFRLPEMTWNDNSKAWEDIEKPRKNEIVCWPIDENGIHRRWRWGIETAMENLTYLMYRENGVGTVYYKYRPPEGMTATTNWIDARYSSTEHGTGYLKKMFTDYALFSYPKSIYAVEDSLRVMGLKKNGIVLDYFAGSATTGHAVINLNREDDGNRKYILVEMGEYFNTVTKPRMQKAVYAKNWKDGKPLSHATGISQIIKYFKLESYEDTLTNIALSDETHKKYSLFGNEYLINYMFDAESKDSRLNLEKFNTPFDYRLKTTEHNETKDAPVDLVETFNYLTGLTVFHQDAAQYYSALKSKTGNTENTVTLKPDPQGDYAFRTVTGILPDGNRCLIIWRTITGDLTTSNAALDAYFTKYRTNAEERNFDIVFVNGDNNLEAIKAANENWKIACIEEEFKNRIFEGSE
ncbi:MAG: site-specific DNA-methyltransferase [Spirochaetaceae bacterium]|jgi:adenine-specific DNA-methyltransferase|nr:site-specific DNA-methyltransferase [Spirochaetaceae bacterium]